MTFIEKITAFRKYHHKSQAEIEREIGVARGTFTNWKKKGYTPRHRTQVKLAEIMGLTIDELMADIPYDPSRSYKAVSWSYAPSMAGESAPETPPVFKYPAPDVKDDESIAALLKLVVLQNSFANPDECYGITMKDSSMEPVIMRGDFMIIRRDSNPSTGDIVIVKTPGDPMLCRKLTRSGHDIILDSFSMHISPVLFREEEIDSLPVIFDGKVISIIRDMPSSSASVQE